MSESIYYQCVTPPPPYVQNDNHPNVIISTVSGQAHYNWNIFCIFGDGFVVCIVWWQNGKMDVAGQSFVKLFKNA